MSIRATIKLGWYWFAIWGCRQFCSVFFNMRILGKANVPAKGPIVLVSNHQCFFDPLFCGMHLPRSMYLVGRDTLFSNRFLGWFIGTVNAIPVRRGAADFAAIRNVITKLRDGGGICLFPEATRTSDGRIADFKPGFGLLCRRSNAAVVPVMLEGAFECWPKHERMFMPGVRIVVEYGEAISAEEVRQMSDKELAECLTERVRQMQSRCRIGQGKEPFVY